MKELRCYGKGIAIEEALKRLPDPRGSALKDKPSEVIECDAFEERAAIMEFDGAMTRAKAEREARMCVAVHSFACGFACGFAVALELIKKRRNRLGGPALEENEGTCHLCKGKVRGTA